MIYYEPERANPTGGIYHQWNTNLCFHRHLHDSFELIYVNEGDFEVTVDSRDYILHQGEAILIFPNQIHSSYTREYSQTYLCIFQNSLIGEFYRTVKNSFADDPVFTISDHSLIEGISSQSTSRYLLKSYLYKVIALLDNNNAEYKIRHNKPHEHVGQILTFIADRHAEQISMKDVANNIGYDYHYLSNLLQKNLKMTFRTLLNEYRISHAKYLLITSNKNISDIAAECGYESLCSFNRNFKAISGMTPSEYQKKTYENNSGNTDYNRIVFSNMETSEPKPH